MRQLKSYNMKAGLILWSKYKEISIYNTNFFIPQEDYNAYYERFIASDLGEIFIAPLWYELVKIFKFKESDKTKHFHKKQKYKKSLFRIILISLSLYAVEQI